MKTVRSGWRDLSSFRLLVVLLVILDTLRLMLYGTRPVDQLMLIIEFLILVFIVWEFGWKVRDWAKARGEQKEYERDM